MELINWEREDVSGWHVRGVEQVGSTQNWWLEEPETKVGWLHKDTQIPANGVEQGEDWSEVVSTRVAQLLGVPCATTRLCTRNGRRGSLSRSVVRDGESLWEGRVALESAHAPGYFPHLEGEPGVDPDRPAVKRPGHSLTNIRDALNDVSMPVSFEGQESLTGYDVFAGYMIFDALIANRDRHEQNWAILMPPFRSQRVHLAPSYDHASSLGYNLSDEKRTRCVEEQTYLESWAMKGTAYRFEHCGAAPTLVDHAVRAVGLCSPQGADWWYARLADCSMRPMQEDLRDNAIPEMSYLAVRFANALLDLNLRRLRDAIHKRT